MLPCLKKFSSRDCFILDRPSVTVPTSPAPAPPPVPPVAVPASTGSTTAAPTPPPPTATGGQTPTKKDPQVSSRIVFTNVNFSQSRLMIEHLDQNGRA